MQMVMLLGDKVRICQLLSTQKIKYQMKLELNGKSIIHFSIAEATGGTVSGGKYIPPGMRSRMPPKDATPDRGDRDFGRSRDMPRDSGRPRDFDRDSGRPRDFERDSGRSRDYDSDRRDRGFGGGRSGGGWRDGGDSGGSSWRRDEGPRDRTEGLYVL